MSKNLTQRVNFEIIRYANCWEDADILLEALSLKQGEKILSIGSAGDNSFSLLVTNPALVVAVDINKIQLYLIELKKACIKTLSREATLKFLGFIDSDQREQVFQSLKQTLSPDAKSYWEDNLEAIRKGVVHQGKFEKYFQLFSRKVLPWIHSQKTTEQLLLNKSEKEQAIFYNEKWNTWRWKLLFRIFFSNYVMGKYGRDPEFLKEVEGSVSKYIYNKAAQHLQSKDAQRNFILRYNLTGNFDSLLPHYLKAENYALIQANIDKLEIKEGYAEEAIQQYGKFSAMNLSNIFEYMNTKLFTETSQSLIEGLEKGGKLAYWNLMVPRRVSAIFPEQVHYEEVISEAMTKKDKGFFYNKFILDRIQ